MGKPKVSYRRKASSPAMVPRIVSPPCVLRAGAGCCEACGSPSDGSWGWVALRGDAVDDLQSLLCAEDSACPECAPEEPEGLFAECLEGECRVVVLEGGPPR